MSILLPGTEIVVHNELYSCIITGLIEHLLKNKKWKTMVIISQKGRFFFFTFKFPVYHPFPHISCSWESGCIYLLTNFFCMNFLKYSPFYSFADWKYSAIIAVSSVSGLTYITFPYWFYQGGYFKDHDVMQYVSCSHLFVFKGLSFDPQSALDCCLIF